MPPKDEKDVGLLDYSASINQLNAIAKKELEDTQHKTMLENANLAVLKDKIIRMTNDFEAWKKQETAKFNKEMNQIRNDMIAKQNEVNMHLQQQQRITIDLQTQQGRFEGLQAERVALKEEMVKVEGQKIQASDMIKMAENLKAEALTLQNVGLGLKKEAEDIQEKNKQENIRLSNLSSSIDEKVKATAEEFKRLTDLKEFVEPKIRTIQEQTDALEKAKVSNQEIIDELNRKIAEEKILLQSVLDKKAQLEKDTKALESDKQEFQRAKLLGKGV